MDKFLNLIGSPRFWATVIALGFVVVKVFVPTIPLNEEEVTGAVVALVAFIVSISVQGSPTVWVDLLKEGKFWILLVSLAFIFIRAFAPSFPFNAALLKSTCCAVELSSCHTDQSAPNALAMLSCLRISRPLHARCYVTCIKAGLKSAAQPIEGVEMAASVSIMRAAISPALSRGVDRAVTHAHRRTG